jgi:transposase
MIGSGFFIWPEWLIELRVRFHKEGSTKMSKTTTATLKSQHACVANCAGIDVSKAWLDVALLKTACVNRFANSTDGHILLTGALRQAGVTRVGLEATGGYEQDVVGALRSAGFEVHVFQPKQVKAYAAFKLQRAKTDRIDALLIAKCTAELDEVRPPPDGRFQGFAALLTLIEQMGEDVIRTKTRVEHVREPFVRAHHASAIKRLRADMRKAYAELAARVKAHADLKARLALIESIDGIGGRTALALLIRMPELGLISREQAASLIGLAPVTRVSGTSVMESHIAGGRMRIRTALFACTQAAIQWNAELKAFYASLIKRGKHHRAAIVACARKLTIFANTVLHRQTPWQSQTATKTNI